MNSSWRAEITAVFAKELRTELRSLSGLLTAGLFGLATVVAVAFGTLATKLSGALAAGLLWVALLFAATLALPRTFLAEEEAGTADLLRLYGRPHAVFWGKALFNLVQMTVFSAAFLAIFLVLLDVPVRHPGLAALAVFGGGAALAGSLTLCGALAAPASNRTALAAAVALPLLVPMIAIGVAALRVAFGVGLWEGGLRAGFGILGYAVLTFAVGPYVFAAVWKS